MAERSAIALADGTEAPNESTRRRWESMQRAAQAIDAARHSGHADGVRDGYRQGWRWGVACGLVSGALVTGLLVWFVTTAAGTL